MTNKINLTEMTSLLKGHHQKFIKKYGVMAGKKIADRALQRDMVYAKISLIAKAYENAGICSEHQEVDIRSVNVSYMRSIALVTIAGTPIYILNGCDHIIVTNGAVSEDAINRTLVLISSKHSTSYNKAYEGVLNDDFDWNFLALEILDAIHKIAYCSTEIIHKFFENCGENEDV